MNRLPQEIIDHVVWWLPVPKSIHRRNGLPASPIRPSIASVSEKFRHAVDREANNHAATAGMHQLLYVLSGWESDLRLELTFEAQSPSDPGALTSRQIGQRWEEIGNGTRYRFEHERYQYSLTEILNVDKMPFVPCVRTVHFHGQRQSRQFSPKAALGLVTRFLQVQTVRTEWREPYWFPDLLKAMRRQLTDSLKSTHFPPTLDELVFELHPPNRISGNLTTSPNPKPDRLCRVLHQAINLNHVAHLRFTGEVDPSLFWPCQPLEKPEPFWQSMKKLEITMAQNSTSTEWYQRTNYNKWSQKTIARYSNLEFPLNHAGLLAPGHGSAREAKRAHRYVEAMFQHERTIYALTYRTLVHGGFRDDNDDNGSDENDNESSAQDGGNSDDADESKYEYDDARVHEMLESCEVNEPPMARLLDAMMKAMLQMRRLESVRLKGCLSEMWCFEFYAPGVPSKYDAKSEATPSYARFILPKRYFWIPGEGILSGFRNMATEKYGQQPAVIWVEHIWRN